MNRSNLSNFQYQVPGTCFKKDRFNLSNFQYQVPGTCFKKDWFNLSNFQYQVPGTCFKNTQCGKTRWLYCWYIKKIRVMYQVFGIKRLSNSVLLTSLRSFLKLTLKLKLQEQHVYYTQKSFPWPLPHQQQQCCGGARKRQG